MKATAKPNGAKRPSPVAKKAKPPIDFEEDSKIAPSDGELSRIAQMVENQIALSDAVVEAEEALSRLKARLRQIQEVDLPEAMREVGFDKIPIKVLGKTVELQSDLTMSIPKDPEKFSAALGWLQGAGLGSLIERDVTMAFGVGEAEKADRLVAALEKKGLHPSVLTSINTSRVKAAVREMLAKGKDVPLEKLGAYRWTKAVVS